MRQAHRMSLTSPLTILTFTKCRIGVLVHLLTPTDLVQNLILPSHEVVGKPFMRNDVMRPAMVDMASTFALHGACPIVSSDHLHIPT